MNKLLKWFGLPDRNEIDAQEDKFKTKYPSGAKVNYMEREWTITKSTALFIPDGIGWVAWLDLERINPKTEQLEHIEARNFNLITVIP